MELVYGLMKPHRIGSICGEHCDQCGGNGKYIMTGPA
jgi:hypothetical protein